MAITLQAGGRETIYASAEVAARVEDLAQMVGEGPGVDAALGSAVVVPDLTVGEWADRWPAFAPPASTASGSPTR